MPTALASTTNRRMPSARNIVSCTGELGSTEARGPVAGVIGSGGLRVRTGGGLPGARGLLGLLALLLGDRGVLVDVLLPGEPHDLVHDLVGDRPEDVAVVLEPLVAREVQRRAEAHHRPGEGPELLPRWRDHVGADDGDRDDRNPGLERQSGHAGLAAVETAVVGAGALGVDPEQLTRV